MLPLIRSFMASSLTTGLAERQNLRPAVARRGRAFSRIPRDSRSSQSRMNPKMTSALAKEDLPRLDMVIERLKNTERNTV